MFDAISNFLFSEVNGHPVGILILLVVVVAVGFTAITSLYHQQKDDENEYH